MVKQNANTFYKLTYNVCLLQYKNVQDKNLQHLYHYKVNTIQLNVLFKHLLRLNVYFCVIKCFNDDFVKLSCKKSTASLYKVVGLNSHTYLF